MQAYCRTSLTYLKQGMPVCVDVDVVNARTTNPTMTWDTSGFELIYHQSAITNWFDADQIEALYYTEIERLVQEICKCDHVLFYPAVTRSPEKEKQHADFKPIQLAHSDYTESYREMISNPYHPYRKILRPTLESKEISVSAPADAKRILTLQFWRNIGEPLVDYPMAFCDCRSVSRDELTDIPVPQYGGLETDFHALALQPPEIEGKHDWYCFPEMTATELVLFRAYDSDRVNQGKPFWTPHTAFLDPNAPADAPRRMSIEMRAICIFD